MDCEQVHRRVIAYDKASFRVWREAMRRRRLPLRGNDADKTAATYDEMMASYYLGWGPEHEQKLNHWLAEP